MAQSFDITKGSGNSVLSKIGGLPDFSSPQTAKDLSGRLQAHTNRVNYFKRMAEQAMQNGNQNSAQAYINQAMAEYDKASAVQDQLAYVQRVSAQRERTDRNAMSRAQARVERNNPVLSSIMDTKPSQIGAMVGGEILRMFDDTAKAGGKALEYLERSLKPTAQNADQAFYNRDFTVSGDPASVMSPEQTINLKDVAKEIGVAGAKNAGTYLDAMNSVRHWFMNNEWGSKPDSEDEKYRKMFGKGAREALGGRELQDPTIARGADVVVDPLAVIPVVGSAGKAVTDPKLWEGIARDMGQSMRSNIFIPITPYQKGRVVKDQILDNLSDPSKGVSVDSFEDAYPKNIADAYKQFIKMKDQGSSPEEIFKKTRVFENVDGVPYYETDDSLAKIDKYALLSGLKGSGRVKITDVFSHPDIDNLILNRFGGRANDALDIIPQKNRGGAFNPETGDISIDPNDFNNYESILFHELGHKFASDAGLEHSGTNYNWARENAPKLLLESERSKIREYVMDATDRIGDRKYEIRKELRALTDETDPTGKARRDLEDELNSLNQEEIDILNMSIASSRSTNANKMAPPMDFNMYLANNGEALSRLSQERMNMLADERYSTFPTDREYMRSAVGVYPEDTWFYRYDNVRPIPVFPKYMEESARNYLLDQNADIGSSFRIPNPNISNEYINYIHSPEYENKRFIDPDSRKKLPEKSK